jgi:hypothetical protein
MPFGTYHHATPYPTKKSGKVKNFIAHQFKTPNKSIILVDEAFGCKSWDLCPHFVPFHLLSLHFHLLSASTVLLDLSLAGLHHFHREVEKTKPTEKKNGNKFWVLE